VLPPGDRLKEATKINLSLSALGNVISALVDSKSGAWDTRAVHSRGHPHAGSELSCSPRMLSLHPELPELAGDIAAAA
jgi:hypothetical protein